MPIMMKGQVSRVVPQCTCSLKEEHRNEDMVVFTVPRAPVRWVLAFLGSMPYLGVAVSVYLVEGHLAPEAVANGSVSRYAHYAILLALFSTYVVMVCWVAIARMHTGQDYLLGGFKIISVLFGMVNLLRMVEEVIR